MLPHISDMAGSTRKSLRKGGPPPPSGRVCEHAGCSDPGDYRAPKSRVQLNEFRWFCIEHVREYNAGWNYYQGMSEPEIEAQIRADTTWRRPTWPLGGKPNPSHDSDPFDLLYDPYDILSAASAGARKRGARRKGPDGNKLTPDEQQALQVLELDWPQTLDTVKVRYKKLVKLHHPDANGGDKDAEERLKVINQAYSTLKQSANFAA